MKKTIFIIIFSILCFSFVTSCDSTHTDGGGDFNSTFSTVLFGPKADCGGFLCL